MILLDANVLLYAYNASSEHHERARSWLAGVLTEPREPVGFPWTTILAFLRISTNPRAFPAPLSVGEAVSLVSDWLESPATVLVAPGERHWAVLKPLLAAGQARGPLVTDAHLAALAIEHGAVLCTTDRDFARFTGVRVANPLEQQESSEACG